VAGRASFRDVSLVAIAVVAVAILLWPRRAYVGAEPASWVRTPGVVNPDVTQATISGTICRRGWTATIRPPTEYTSGLKLRQLRALALPGGPARYQEDHLVSLELGGHPTDTRNLWPEVRPRADDVDRIENELNAKICAGRISLREGQLQISRIKHTAG
jgi:hypothetical protein